jgi:hypothetical protein
MHLRRAIHLAEVHENEKLVLKKFGAFDDFIQMNVALLTTFAAPLPLVETRAFQDEDPYATEFRLGIDDVDERVRGISELWANDVFEEIVTRETTCPNFHTGQTPELGAKFLDAAAELVSERRDCV